MCDYCASHGGKLRWYLNPDNYSDRFLDDKKRMKILYDITGWGIDQYLDYATGLSKKAKIPILGRLVRKVGNRVIPNKHSGQVIKLEDALKIVDLADNLCLLDCMCRKNIRGSKEGVCINFGPIKELFQKLKPSEKVEVLTPDQAKELIKQSDNRGYYHQVLFAKLPYPVVVCNCDANSCTAFKLRFNFGIQRGLVKGHEVSELDYNKCDGCDELKVPICLQHCQFEAIKWNSNEKLIQINKNMCFGCGLCSTHCPKGAISLQRRKNFPEIKQIW
ncbi:MAG: ATP-binding protein [Promethearchaeota archaeon]